MQTADHGILRFSPDRGQHIKRTQSRGSAVGTALGAVLVGGLGLRKLDLGAGLWIAGTTVVVTLVAVSAWRWLLPRTVSLTVAPEAVTYRRFGRSTTVSRGPGTEALAALISFTNATTSTPYLCLRGQSGQFCLNLNVWGSDDQVGMKQAVGATDQTADPMTVAQFDEHHPDLLPGWVLHPSRYALILIVVAVAGIIGVTALVRA